MNYDSFLSTPRWEILQILAEKPSSPIEIAEKLNTTVSYSSQQLTLLNAAGIVSKKRTGAFEKGKPRNLYSISKEIAYLTSLSEGFAEKRLLDINNEHKAVLMFWTLYPEKEHNVLQKIFWKLFDFDEEYSIITNENNFFILVSDEKKLRDVFSKFFKENKSGLNIKAITKSEFSKSNDSMKIIYFHSKKMKGGEGV